MLIDSLRDGRVATRRRRALGLARTPITAEDIARIERIWSSQKALPPALLDGLPADVQQVLSAPIVGSAGHTIHVELRSSDSWTRLPGEPI